MICFPHCKINLGLKVIQKRPDGFHDIETVLYPIQWCDALEVIENPGEKDFTLDTTGLSVPGSTEQNIIYKAWQLITEKRKLPPIRVHLRKVVPMGAGLGGGSSDAAFFIQLLNHKFSLNLSKNELFSMAGKLGSDCAFFLQNKPVLATGKGDVFSQAEIILDKYHLLIIYPGVHSNTAQAYGRIQLTHNSATLRDIIKLPITEWKNHLENDFEKTVMEQHPVIAELKQIMYKNGAVYASMSGSGSSVFGIFEKKPDVTPETGWLWFHQKPGKIL